MLRAIFASFLLGLNIGCFLRPIQAQVISDETLDSQVNQINNNQLVITGGKEAGKNLFHSFFQFSIPSNGTVHFDNSTNIENIFSRVTGGLISDINGLIKANGNASLFLLNPAGIIFGQNAQLDLGGSFIATTAEAIVFVDGIEFSAVNNETETLLTVNIPMGLQYGKSPGAIISNGIVTLNPSNGEPIELPVLSINSGNTIALVGGKVLLKSTRLETNAARTEIGSVASQEFVNLQPDRNGWIISYDNVNEFGQVELSDLSGIESGNGGSIQIRGKEIKISTSLIANVTSQDIDGGRTDLIATDLIEIDNSFILTQVGDEIDRPTAINTSKGGNILLAGNRIKFANGSGLSAGTTNLGDGGNITIYAQDLVELSGKNEIATSFISTSTSGDGAGGEILVNTKNLLIQDGGQIQAASFGGGEAGTIKVNATESITIAGTEVVPRFAENSQAIIGERVLQSGLFANTESGTGGEINLTASLVLLEDNGIISATANNNGNGGNIGIATETLVLFEPSHISANAEEGMGGNINIKTQGLFVADEVDRQITASSQLGIDGIVDINTPDIDSKINTIVVERSPLATKNLIHTGCSLNKDYISNQFKYIGRGGLPFNPLEEIITEDLMVDLGNAETSAQQKSNINWSSDAVKLKPNQEIREATDWVVNQRGNVELTASTPKETSTSVCQFHSFLY